MEHRQGVGNMALVGRYSEIWRDRQLGPDLLYRAVIQAVLLFGSKSLTLLYVMMRTVEITYVEFLIWITEKRARRKSNGSCGDAGSG